MRASAPAPFGWAHCSVPTRRLLPPAGRVFVTSTSAPFRSSPRCCCSLTTPHVSLISITHATPLSLSASSALAAPADPPAISLRPLRAVPSAAATPAPSSPLVPFPFPPPVLPSLPSLLPPAMSRSKKNSQAAAAAAAAADVDDGGVDLDDAEGGGKGVSGFISKIYKMVSDPNTQDVVSWNERGDGFIVKNEFVFASQIMRTYFRHQNFSSFVRQLNFYGFHKRSSPSSLTSFYHPSFKKGHPELLSQIVRKSTETSQTDTQTDARTASARGQQQQQSASSSAARSVILACMCHQRAHSVWERVRIFTCCTRVCVVRGRRSARDGDEFDV